MDAEKVVRASWDIDMGTPVKDLLTDEEVIEVIHTLADILMITGVRFPDDE